VDATSPTTGSIITPGGIGCAKDIWAANFKTNGDINAVGTLYVPVVEGSSTQNATSATTGGIRATAGGIGCAQDVWAGQKVIVNSSANSNSITTGALIVSDGGIGCKKNTYVGGHGHFAAAENSTSAADGAVHAPNGGIGCALDAWIGGRVIANSSADATNLTDGAIRSLGGLSVLKNLVMGGVLQNEIVQNATSAITGALRAINGGISCALDIWAGGDIYSNSPTASTSTTTGAIRTLGGIGAGGAVYAGGKFVTSNTTNSTSTTTGSIITPGGIGAGGAVYAGGKLVTTDTTAATNEITGSIITPGGVGVGKGVWVSESVTAASVTLYLGGSGQAVALGSDVSDNIILNPANTFNSVKINKQVSANGTLVALDGGAFTPTLSCSSGTPAITYTVQTGYYQNNGKMTTYHVKLWFTQTGGFPNQDVWVEGLPGIADITDGQGQPVSILQGSAGTTQAQVVKDNASGKMVLYATDRNTFKFDPFYAGAWKFTFTGTYYRP
jgi:hypothetical protein